MQQYDFAICYRSGKSHRNADGLSRRPCQDEACRYCEKVETREVTVVEGEVGRIILSEENFGDWHTAQLEDPATSTFLLAKEVGERPLWREVTAHEDSTKVYWSQ